MGGEKANGTEAGSYSANGNDLKNRKNVKNSLINDAVVVDLSSDKLNLTEVLILIFYHCIPFSPFPTVVIFVALFSAWKRYGLLPLLLFAAWWFVMIKLPLYYDREFRKKWRVCYDALAHYAKSCRTVLPAKPPPSDRPYVLGLHPHGRVMYSTTFFMQMDDVIAKLLPKGDLFGTAAGGFFATPVVRHWFAALGGVPAGKSSLAKVLRRGDNVAIVVGGVREVCIPTKPDKDIIYLKKRLGFVRLAMEEKAGLIPVYLFGENQLFKPEPRWWLKIWEVVNKYVNIGVPFFRGPWNLPCPYSRDLLIAVGEPVIPQDGESVEEVHARYVQAVTDLFDKYVGMSFHPKHKLVIT